MSKTRVYEVARELGLDNRELLTRLASLGIQVRNHMSAMDQAEVDRVKRSMDKDKQKNVVEERIRPTVVRRRVKKAKAEESPVVEASAESARPSDVTAEVAPPPPAADSGARSAAAEQVASAGGENSPLRPETVARERVSRPPAATSRPPGAASASPEPRDVRAAEERELVVPATTPPAPEPRKSAAPAAPVETNGVERQRPRVSSAPPTSAASPAPQAASEPPVSLPSKGPERRSTPPHGAKQVAESSGGGRGPDSNAPTLPPRRRGPLSYAERLGNTDLPPGVVARGSLQGQKAAPLSAAARSRIVSEHAAKTAQPPRRRELVRSAIGPTGRQQQRGRPGRARKLAPGKKAQKTEITVPSAAKRVIRIEGEIGLQVLAQRMSLKATDVLGKLMRMGMTGVMINSTLDYETASILASEFGFEVENVAVTEDDMVSDARGSFDDQEVDRVVRPPVVTVMGHVDHGKTSLLDKIRRSRVAAGEAGGITQHLGAYRVESKRGTMVFLDTPGHAAFTAMRARGANATDVVVLVVAADDGVMPQTKEAIDHAKAAGVPIVVAVNKMDKEDARPDVIMRDLANDGLQPEEWGGNTMFFKVSAMTGDGIDDLLEGISLQAEVLELKANPAIPAEGVVLEAYLDKGRGPVANVLVQNGTLQSGSVVVAGTAWGKIRAMTDDRGKPSAKAVPSTPVEVLGLSEVPNVGDMFHVVTDVKIAQQVVERRRRAVSKGLATGQKASLEALVEKMKEGAVEELRLVVKADVQGSAEALVKSLVELSTEKVRVSVIHSGAGGITENDVMLASASNAIVIGFHVRATGGATKTAKAEQVQIKTYNIIYEALDDVKKAMVGLLKPVYREVQVGRAEVRAVFSIPRGTIAGCYVQEGKISRSNKARLFRDGQQVWEGSIKSLRRVKDDVRDVSAGLECGVGLEGCNDIQEKDVIECFDLEEVSAVL